MDAEICFRGNFGEKFKIILAFEVDNWENEDFICLMCSGFSFHFSGYVFPSFLKFSKNKS